MAIDLQEQEQLDNLKDWWKRNGNRVTWVLIVALFAYAAWAGWRYYQTSQSQQASVLYEELQKAITSKDPAKISRAAGDIQSKFGRTSYGQMSALQAAKAQFDAKDLKAAKASLQWAVDNAQDGDYKQIAQIRLAGVLLDEKAYDEALKQLSGSFSESFQAIAADRKGDILSAQNKAAEARTAYEEAIKKSGEQSNLKNIVQLKLDSLPVSGSVSAPAAAPAAAPAPANK